MQFYCLQLEFICSQSGLTCAEMSFGDLNIQHCMHFKRFILCPGLRNTQLITQETHICKVPPQFRAQPQTLYLSIYLIAL